MKRYAPWLLAVAGGVLYFLGFAGFAIWPLAFIALVPLALAVELEKGAKPKRHFALGFVYGFITYAGGYYWLVEFLDSKMPLTSVFVARFLQRLRLSPAAFAPLGWLEQWMADEGMPSEQAASVATNRLAITQVMMAGPLYGLYEITVWIAWYWEQPDRAKARRTLLLALLVLAGLAWLAHEYAMPWLKQLIHH